MPARKKQHVSRNRAHSGDNSVCAFTDLLGHFPSGRAVPKQVPIRALGADFDTSEAFILAIIPFDEIGIDFSNGPKPGQLACPARASQRTREHLHENQSLEASAEPPGGLLALDREWEVGESSVLASQGPSSFAVPSQINHGEFLTHWLSPCTDVVDSCRADYWQCVGKYFKNSSRSSHGDIQPFLIRIDSVFAEFSTCDG
jgi:hypothetical protein